MNISTGKITKPQKIVIYGVEGIGKTTLASKFPDPLFIDTEGSTAHLDVKRADPAPSSWSMLLGYIGNVIADPSVCSTLVIDTADWAERLCVEHILAKNNWATIESPGYGKGYREVNEEFGRMLDKLTDVIERGVNVVVTAHARISKFEQPDELGAYDRWSLKLFDSPKSSNAAMLKEWADMVLFLNYKTNIVSPDSKTGGKAKAVGGKRVMYTTHTPAWDAKNRCGLADELPMDYASIASCITGKAEQPKAAKPAAKVSDDVIAKAQAASAEHKQIMDDLKAKEKKPAKKREEQAPSTNKGKLSALMQQAGVDISAIEQYCAGEGYCPPGTAFDAYPEDFCGYLVTQWDKIAETLGVPF